jgi:CheY-like chemotaxis protein
LIPQTKCEALVVEDDPSIVLLLKRAFRKAGLDQPVAFASDGDDAIDYLSGRGKYEDRDRYPVPDLVLLDLHLPKRSGLEVLTWIRSDSAYNRLPVVILTGSASNATVRRAYELGANSVLFAPLDQDGLMEMIRAIREYWLGFNRGTVRSQEPPATC